MIENRTLKSAWRYCASFVLSLAHGSLLVAGVMLVTAMAYQYSAHGVQGLDPRSWASALTGSDARQDVVAVSSEVPEALSPEYQRLVQYIAKRHRVASKGLEHMVHVAIREGRASNIDPVLILAVTSIESGFNPMAESGFGAQGLMQIIPRFHHDKIDASLGVNALLEPAENIRVGARILREYLRNHGAIETALQQYGGVSDASNFTYPNKVLNELERFRQVMKTGTVRTQIAQLGGETAPDLPTVTVPTPEASPG